MELLFVVVRSVARFGRGNSLYIFSGGIGDVMNVLNGCSMRKEEMIVSRNLDVVLPALKVN